jgi:hypothetical protein
MPVCPPEVDAAASRTAIPHENERRNLDTMRPPSQNRADHKILILLGGIIQLHDVVVGNRRQGELIVAGPVSAQHERRARDS